MQQQQATADGQVLQQTEYLYEPGSFRPMAQVTHHNQGSELHYIVTDHAGTPQELCNEQGDIVWRGEQALWGHYHGQSQRHWQRREEAANDSIQCDLRYQGQLEDPESGLYYNVNRYYDADSGQYLSPDPIGFAGGLRPQAYVANPLEWVDPLGLAGCPERDEKIRHIAEKHGGTKLEDGGYHMPSKRAAKNAASEIAGDLGSNVSKVRRKDYLDISNTYQQNQSNRVIGKISADKSSGYYDHSIGHHFDRRPHINVWSKKFGATAKDNFHLYY